MQKNALRKMFEKYVRRTPREAAVFKSNIDIARISPEIADSLNTHERNVSISTRSLKHLYDKKPAEEFDAILDNLAVVIENPDTLYKNKDHMRGNYCITKYIGGVAYLVSLEIPQQNAAKTIQVVTSFRVRDSQYLEHYDLLRSWRDGAHSSPHRPTE